MIIIIYKACFLQIDFSSFMLTFSDSHQNTLGPYFIISSVLKTLLFTFSHITMITVHLAFLRLHANQLYSSPGGGGNVPEAVSKLLK